MDRKLSLRAGGASLAFVAALVMSTVAFAHVGNVTLDPVGALSPGGTMVAVAGSVTCDAGESGYVYVQLHQRQGQREVSGSGSFYPLACTGGVQTWQATVSSTTSDYAAPAFSPGRATARVTAYTCHDPSAGPCDLRVIDATIHLRR
jgi:hypothetical protein